MIFFIVSLFTRLPFNWKQPIGYAIALSMQCIEVYYSVMAGVILGSYAIGSCFLLKSFVNDITNDILLFNLEAAVSDHNYELTAKRFIHFVQEFSNVKELSQWIWMEFFIGNDSFNFFFSNSRFIREFNRDFQYFVIVNYFWSRLTMLSSTITLFFVLVEYIEQL